MAHLLEAQSSGATVLKVSNKDSNEGMVKAFLHEFRAVDLLLAYGSAFDEGALVRDVHKAGLDCNKVLKNKGVFNLYPACARLKQAHDLMFNLGYRELCAATGVAQNRKPYDLDAMHNFFVKSTGRRFVEPLPEGKLLFV